MNEKRPLPGATGGGLECFPSQGKPSNHGGGLVFLNLTTRRG